MSCKSNPNSHVSSQNINGNRALFDGKRAGRYNYNAKVRDYLLAKNNSSVSNSISEQFNAKDNRALFNGKADDNRALFLGKTVPRFKDIRAVASANASVSARACRIES